MTNKLWAPLTAAILVVGATGGGLAAISGSEQASAAARPALVQTAPVQKRMLSAILSESGTLTYRGQASGSPYSVIDQASGIYTELPAAGQVISPGHVLYRVDNSPVVLLEGLTPAYRTLSAGASGPDVAELNADLVALGYTTSAALNPRSTSFGSATTTAVQKLQAAMGIAQTGTLTLGQAVFEPGAMRVTSVSAQLGGRTQPGQQVLQATSTIRQVQVALDASQQTSIALGDRVGITLPDNRTTAGRVTSIGAVATCPSSSGSSGPGSSPTAPGTDACASASAGSSTPTITVGITPVHPAATGRWDQAPVQVAITTSRVPDALVVPVTALLARSGGSYAVEVVRAGMRSELVPVSLGLFDDADGLVQVIAPRLAAGQKVVVPAT